MARSRRMGCCRPMACFLPDGLLCSRGSLPTRGLLRQLGSLAGYGVLVCYGSLNRPGLLHFDGSLALLGLLKTDGPLHPCGVLAIDGSLDGEGFLSNSGYSSSKRLGFSIPNRFSRSLTWRFCPCFAAWYGRLTGKPSRSRHFMCKEIRNCFTMYRRLAW